MARGLPSVLLAALLAGALAGCGGEGDTSAGARVFKSAGCAGCHTLAAADARGTVGPNLDALKPDSAAVVRQVTNGGNGMPAFGRKLSADQIYKLAAYVKAATRGSIVVLAKFKPDRTRLSDCARGQSFTCYEQAFGNVTYYKGPKKSLALLQANMGTNSAVATNCHRIAHKMGGAAFARFKGRVGRAFAAGTAVCWSGYYHGVVEHGFAGAAKKDLAKKARAMCSEPFLRRDLFLSYQCVHGLGHGLMLYTNYDLPLSLKTCDQLSSPWDQSACTGGVFMENFTSFYKVKSKWLKSSDLLYPCDAVKDRYKYFCYYMVTSRALSLRNYDFKAIAKICRAAEWEWVSACFESFGRDASGYSGTDARLTLKLCRLAGDHQSDCVYAVARDIINNDAGRVSRAARFCNLTPHAVRARCFTGVGTVLGTLNPSYRGRVKACGRWSGRYSTECVRGALVEGPPLLTPSAAGRARRR
jgi:cytochrome c553